MSKTWISLTAGLTAIPPGNSIQPNIAFMILFFTYNQLKAAACKTNLRNVGTSMALAKNVLL